MIAAAPNQTAPKPTSSDWSGALERLALVHVGGLVVFGSWAFGGNAPWAESAMSVWGSFGVLLTVAAGVRRRTEQPAHSRPLTWLWPLVLLNAYVLISVFNPSYREVFDGAESVFVRDPTLPAWPLLPSTARPDVSLRALWFFDAIYLTGLNLVLLVRRRRGLRRLFVVLAANALVLAVFGTVQKLTGATGLFFGAQPVPQSHFFASFIYHNHWGAFTLLMTAVTLGLIAHYSRHRQERDFWHSPAPAALVSLLFLAATIPLSASRSCTVLVLLLLGAAFVAWLRRHQRAPRSHGRSRVLPIGLALLGLATAGGFIFTLGKETIRLRVRDTQEQFTEMRAKGEYPREVLYRDTWRLAREKLWSGWGMGAYPTAFYHHNTQHDSSNGPNRLFHDAHSDWLQSIAELGLVGTALLLLCAAVPLWGGRRATWRSPIMSFLLGGCGLLVLYALVEFPFGNHAVVAAWWLCFFAALQYGRLSARSASRLTPSPLAYD